MFHVRRTELDRNSTVKRSRDRGARILGGTAARLFKLPPRNERQSENLLRFGNLPA
jgi:hypothetical protein